MKAIVSLDYSKTQRGGPISILSISIFNSKNIDVTSRYETDWIYGYDYSNDEELKKDINKKCKTRLSFIETR
jgi:hypothetical protein